MRGNFSPADVATPVTGMQQFGGAALIECGLLVKHMPKTPRPRLHTYMGDIRGAHAWLLGRPAKTKGVKAHAACKVILLVTYLRAWACVASDFRKLRS